MDINSCDWVRPSPVRRIQPTRRSVSGIHAFRGETAIPYESTLERDFLIRMEFQLGVLDVIPQPVEIPFTLPNGRSFTYTPDYFVFFRASRRSYSKYPMPLLVEVKPQSEWRTHWRQWLPKWKAARRYAKLQGAQFRLFDESRIRDEALSNIQFLVRYKRMQFAPEDCQAVCDALGDMGSVPIDYLVARYFVGRPAEGIALIWHLLATRQIDCDITRKLANSTEVWISDRE
jgi:hypothetical protein